MTDHPHALYRFFDAAGTLLYVGITLDPGARWRAHRDDKPWWVEVTSITVATHPSRSGALAAERVAIDTESPKHSHRGGTRMTMRTLRTPHHLWEQAKAQADAEEKDISQVVRELLERYVRTKR